MNLALLSLRLIAFKFLPIFSGQGIFKSLMLKSGVFNEDAVFYISFKAALITKWSFFLDYTFLDTFVLLSLWQNLVVFILIGIALITAFIWFFYKKSVMQKKELERLEAAQNRIRQQTAQDFHDEIGNKITRINLLTLMAEKKAVDNEELLTILKQIRNNTQMLYSGAKDVIWSLQKDSDYLKEALLHIEQNAIALLNDTGVIVRIEESSPIKNDILMPIDYGRNLMLIFKEAINNALKYSGADLLLLRFYEDIDNSIVLELEDNGKGFDVLNANYGNGLGNMRTRAENIKAKFSIQSKAGQGTLIRLRMFPYSFQ